MAEHNFSLSVTPKSIESDPGNSRRHSMGKASSSTSGEKVLPHYLRASTGSCHDFCKYGRKHALEAQARRPFLRRNVNKPLDEQISVELQPDGNETSKFKHKYVPYKPPCTPEIIKGEASRKLHNRQTPKITEVMAEMKTSSELLLTKSVDRQSPVLRQVLAKKKTTAKEVLTKSVDSQSSVSSECLVERRRTSTQEMKKIYISAINLRASPSSKTQLSPKIMKPDVSSSSEKLEVSLKQASSKVKEKNISAKHTNSLKLKLISPDSCKVFAVRGNRDDKIGQRTTTSKIAVKKERMSSGDLPSPKTSSGKVARGLAVPDSSVPLKPLVRLQMSPRDPLFPKTSSRGIARGLASPKTFSLKHSLNRVASLKARELRVSEVASPLKNQSKIVKTKNEHPKNRNDDPGGSTERPNNDAVQEKTLYVIKTEIENKYLESDHKENHSSESSPSPILAAKSPSLSEPMLSSSHNGEDEEESEYTVTEAEDDLASEYDEIEYMEEADTLEREHKGWNRKTGMVPSQDKNDQPVKLRFRRGKVINIQSNLNGPRKLKFRRGRMLEENQNFRVEARRNFKRRGVEGLINDGESNSEKIVLRHQDVHGKKDAQGLFNNVIEETASKLVETRKSKVKALVGAFETVISLQDKNHQQTESLDVEIKQSKIIK